MVFFDGRLKFPSKSPKNKRFTAKPHLCRICFFQAKKSVEKIKKGTEKKRKAKKKKMKKARTRKRRISGFILRRSVIVGVLILIQLLFLMLIVAKMAEKFVFIYSVLLVFSLSAVIYIVGAKINPAYKLAWAILILSFPIFGGMFYLMFGTSRVSSGIKKKLELQSKVIKPPKTPEKIKSEARRKSENFYSLINYTDNFYPAYCGESSEYYKNGEAFYEALLAELKAAKKYIFLEYFIIKEGKMWDGILEILKEKAQNGVDVRIIYDDCGCMGGLPLKYYEYLGNFGIKARAFNTFRPSLSITMNNRDHRKILIIDGKTAFTGGINLADEYINEISLHGYWKDNAVKLTGECVNSFVLMFFEMWNLIKFDEKSPEKYFCNGNKSDCDDGFVQPYADQPYDDDTVGENIYLNLINKAKSRIFITTPYLIIDNELTQALILASKSGVKITIITPGIPDKRYVHTLTRSAYPLLLENGIEIYEYEKGFIHAKTFLCDDEIATVGSVNMDYRSLYLHFECGVLLYGQRVLSDIKKDFEKIISDSRKITVEECKKAGFFVRLLRSILRVFAPLM